MNRLIVIALTLPLLASVGCIVPPATPAPGQSPPAAPAAPVDPFNLPPAPGLPGGSGSPYAPDCPDGICPLPYGSTDSVDTIGAALADPPTTLASTSMGTCIDARPPTESEARAEKKTGAFKCEICARPTVGAQFADLWAGRISLHCMCKECYAQASPAKREATLRAYLQRSNIDPSRSDIRAAVQAIVHR